ncbi:MAG: hypothetical protein SWZ49_30435, partial [Cyanobacteriota bacterium]|nr:hypothetical protein [Cyanobacteriota bacterium]
AGLTLIDHYLKLYRINIRLKQTLKSYGFKGDYGIGDILFSTIISLAAQLEAANPMYEKRPLSVNS